MCVSVFAVIFVHSALNAGSKEFLLKYYLKFQQQLTRVSLMTVSQDAKFDIQTMQLLAFYMLSQ